MSKTTRDSELLRRRFIALSAIHYTSNTQSHGALAALSAWEAITSLRALQSLNTNPLVKFEALQVHQNIEVHLPKALSPNVSEAHCFLPRTGSTSVTLDFLRSSAVHQSLFEPAPNCFEFFDPIPVLSASHPPFSQCTSDAFIHVTDLPKRANHPQPTRPSAAINSATNILHSSTITNSSSSSHSKIEKVASESPTPREINSIKIEDQPKKRTFRDLDANPSEDSSCFGFMTGSEKLVQDQFKQQGRHFGRTGVEQARKRSVGLVRSGIKRKFVPPFKEDLPSSSTSSVPVFVSKAVETLDDESFGSPNDTVDERLKNCDSKLVAMITSEILDHRPEIKWSDIAGLEFAKQCVMEIVVWPMQRPEWFTGLRAPPKGILLFGPPGTGKTLIGKAIASEAGAKFFSISASSLGSKWHGEGEKLVRTLFAVAAVHQPSIIFIDEIDSLLAQRSEGDFEGSRRMKTEFLIRLDGLGTSAQDRVLVVGATNRPQELDEAARRRLVKRLYIPLPDEAGRKVLMENLLRKENHNITEQQIIELTSLTKGYSGADLRALCTEAAFGPLRDLKGRDRSTSEMRSITFHDFLAALKQVRASVSQSDLQQYMDWNRAYGSFPADSVENC